MAVNKSNVHPHEKLIKEVYGQMKEIFEGSKQAIYIYHDDTHKICNKKFASLLGYKSPEEWSAVNKPFTEAFVEGESREILVTSYSNAMEDKIGSCIEVLWKKKTDESVRTKVIMVPISHSGEFLALHENDQRNQKYLSSRKKKHRGY